MLIMNKPAEARGEMTVATKRRLRRMRLGAAKDGVVIPYDGVSQPADPNAPKLTNTAKRRNRQRKKYEQEMEAWAAENDGDVSTFPRLITHSLPTPSSDEKKTKAAKSKKKKKKKGGEDGVEINATDSVVKKKKKKTKSNEPGHLRFDVSDTEEEPVVKELKKVKKVSKKKKEKSAAVEKCDDEVTEEGDDELEGMDVDKVGSEDKPRKKTGDKCAGDESKPDKANKPPKKRRFVLFVGNLAYDVTEEQVKAHFQKVGEIVSVRLAKPLDDGGSETCRGFCHLEVADEETYLKALSMTHTFMGKRRINVEYSGSQTQGKKAEQKKKNMKMNALRKSGNLFEVMNPTGSGAAQNKTERRNQAKRDTQKQGNTFWL